MQITSTGIHSHRGRASLTFVFGMVCALMLIAPLLAYRSHLLGAAIVYMIFSPVCHQIHERSFSLFGYPWAVCHRCSGIYFGMFLALLLRLDPPRILKDLHLQKFWVIGATLPLALDVLLPFAGIWNSTPFSRLLTGLIFGQMASSLLAPAISDFLREPPWSQRPITIQTLK